MKEKITHITDDQKAKMPQYVDKWIKTGTNTVKAANELRKLMGSN